MCIRARCQVVGRTHESGAKLAPVALIGQRRIGEAITDDDLTACKSGLDDLVHHLGASGFEEQELCERRHRVIFLVEEQRADLLAQARAARLVHT